MSESTLSSLDAFMQRKDTYATQKDDGSYSRVSVELNERAITAHLKGEETIAVYQLDKNNNVKWLCFDFDDGPEEGLKKVKELITRLKAYELEALVEFSGMKGYHVWVFLEEVPAAEARRLALRIAGKLGCEVFPKQDKLGPDGFGNCVKLPLGIHKVSGNRSYFLNQSFEPLDTKQSLALLGTVVPGKLPVLNEELEETATLGTSDKLFQCPALVDILEDRNHSHQGRLNLSNCLKNVFKLSEEDCFTFIKQHNRWADFDEHTTRTQIKSTYQKTDLRPPKKVNLCTGKCEHCVVYSDKVQFPPEIEAKAKEILEKGSPLKFLIDTISKAHVGDDGLKALEVFSILSLGVKSDELHTMTVARSGKGKSNLKGAVLKCLPAHRYYSLSDISAKALQYASEKKNLDHVVLYFDEGEAAKDTIPVLRALTSGSTGTKTTQAWTVKDQDFLELNIPGRQVVWISSVNPIKDDQLKNRFILANTDESQGQDEAVFKLQKEKYGYGRENAELPEDFRICQAMLEQLLNNEEEVVIPFVDQIQFTDVSNRRNFPIFLLLVKMSAKLHGYQRPKTGGVLIATKADFELARMIWDGVIRTQASKVDQICLKLYEALSMDPEKAMSRRDLFVETKVPTTTQADKFELLCEAGLVNSEKEKNKWVYWKTSETLRLPTTEVFWDSFDVSECKRFFNGYIRREGSQKELEEVNYYYKEIVGTAVRADLEAVLKPSPSKLLLKTPLEATPCESVEPPSKPGSLQSFS